MRVAICVAGGALPRKYRPPAARRRKTKRQAPYFVEPLPDGGEGVAASQHADGAATFEEVETEQAVSVATAARAVPPPVAERPPSPTTKHIAKDYSYVRAEVRRIVLVGGFLIMSLIITALLRN